MQVEPVTASGLIRASPLPNATAAELDTGEPLGSTTFWSSSFVVQVVLHFGIDRALVLMFIQQLHALLPLQSYLNVGIYCWDSVLLKLMSHSK
ncbi:unnamed protein product [Trifolium pratense]|uniref:Uncharacterized protein n=1 Tax=Trifolium pratense TaxID=57577 RepID=A0ACB0KVD7_TRIPR|nr:unnamed protein product [Trifolium pratense]